MRKPTNSEEHYQRRIEQMKYSILMDKKAVAKMAVLLNLTYRFNVITIKIPANYFVLMILRFIWRGKSQSRQHNIQKENQRWRTDTTQLH